MKTKVRASGASMVALVFSVLAPTAVFADTPREIAKRVSPLVVLLVMEDASGQPLSMGSGFIVQDGVVATNMHVIESAARGYAKLVDDKTKHNILGIVASDAARDLVLLAIDGLKADGLSIGDSDGVAVGDAVYAVGNPRGLEGTFSAGIISSVRKIGEDSLLQVTAPISPGSSGGPVVDSSGKVIGVAVATFKGGQNLNFAIPSRYLSALIPTIKAPVDLPKAAEARKAKQEKSILSEMGGKSTDGVTAGQLIWDLPGNQFSGAYSLTLRNQLREAVKNVVCLVVLYGNDGEPIETGVLTYDSVIPPGLAKRARGEVDGSVKKLTGDGDAPKTKVEFRILYFDIVNPDEPVDEQGRAMQTPKPPAGNSDADNAPAATARGGDASSLDDAEAELRTLEKRLAEAAAKIAPAGDGPDLIESRIEGEFEGWDGDTILHLANGQIWQQVTYAYTYHYAYRPEVTIYKTNGAYKMKVDGVSSSIFVKRLK